MLVSVCFYMSASIWRLGENPMKHSVINQIWYCCLLVPPINSLSLSVSLSVSLCVCLSLYILYIYIHTYTLVYIHTYRTNSWTKIPMNMKFQMSLCLIIPQSLEFRFFFKKCLFCGYYGKYAVLLDWLLRT